MSLEIALLALVAAAGFTGWFLAWRARGEALAGGRSASAAADAQRTEAMRADHAEQLARDADARAGAAHASLQLAAEKVFVLDQSLTRERQRSGGLLERLAKAGVPIGGDLVDDALGGLYAHGDGRSPGGGDPDPVSGGAPVDLPGQPASAPAPALPT